MLMTMMHSMRIFRGQHLSGPALLTLRANTVLLAAAVSIASGHARWDLALPRLSSCMRIPCRGAPVHSPGGHEADDFFGKVDCQ